MQDALYGGVNTAVLTPMRDDLAVDLDVMAARCRWLLANGADGLAVLGTTGEANSLGVAERLDLLEGLVARGVPGRAMLPGCGTPAITDTVALMRRAEAVGCRGVLLLPPFFYKSPSEDGLFAYFSEVIERAGAALKIYLYHFPAQSAVPFSLGLIARLLRAFPSVIKGLKDSTGDFVTTRGFVEAFASEGFEVYCGDDGALLDLLRIGGAGSISAASNVSSPLNARVYAAWDKPEGEAAQKLLTGMRRAVTSAPLIPGLKSLVARQTGDAAWANIRPPHVRLSAEQEAALFAAFDACRPELAAAA